MRKTTIAHGRLAMREARLSAARKRAIGTQALAIEHVVARLAGGFVEVVDAATLRETIVGVLDDVDLGELEPIKDLPGFPRAAAATLMKLWLSGIDIEARRGHPRVEAILVLDEAVRAALPPVKRPPDELARLARERISLATKILGPVTIQGMTELHPVWRDVLVELATVVSVTWEAGPREVPDWISRSGVTVTTSGPAKPRITAASCSTSRHEAIEALRWARSLMVLGIPASDIAIATTSTRDYDDHFVSLVSEAGFPMHFVHGLTAVNTSEGQAAAALADVLLRGLSQKRIRRLIELIGDEPEIVAELPEDWDETLPPDAALTTVERWKKAFDRRERSAEAGRVMMPIIEMLARGPDVAAEAGEKLLTGRALAVWQRALSDGPPSALDQTIEALRVDDGVDPFSSLAYMNAEALATVPRKHVRLLGLTSRTWPRGISEDALIPSHVIPTRDLDPLPLNEIDRRDFDTILATTSASLVLSWARRDAEGRVLGISSLVPGELIASASRLSRTGIPHHAMSESDRLLARADEFADLPRAISAGACWEDWSDREVTAHDGLVRPDHPRIKAALRQFHSTTSLRSLLRDPLGFVWQYALGWRAPEFDDEPLMLDARHFGNLVHDVLRRTVESLEAEGGYANKSQARIRKAIEFCAYDAGVQFQITQPVPATLIWRSTMDSVVAMAEAALFHEMEVLPKQASYTEVPFGGGNERSYGNAPWNTDALVKVPGTDIKVRGFIDRIDLSGDGNIARVTDYKTGKVPKDVTGIILNGGQELQRCIYGFAVRALLGDDVSIESGLLYPRGDVFASLENADDVLSRLADYVRRAVDGVTAGRCLPGTDAESAYNDMRFALPANAGATYLKRKNLAVIGTLGDVTEIWGEE